MFAFQMPGLGAFGLLYYMNAYPQHLEFPFFQYVPLTFYPQWHHQTPLLIPKPVAQTNITNNFSSLNEIPEVPSSQKPRQAPKALKRPSAPSKRAKEKEQLKRKKEKEDDYSRKRQKKDRNLPSNIFKMLTSFLYYHPNILGFIQKHTPRSINIDPTVFLDKFKKTLRPSQSYVRPSVVQDLCSQGIFSTEESLVFRIILRKFMRQELALEVVELEKLKKGQKMAYLKLARSLHHQLNANFFK